MYTYNCVRKGPTHSWELCSCCCLEVLTNFIFELVFHKSSLIRRYGKTCICGSLLPHWHTAFAKPSKDKVPGDKWWSECSAQQDSVWGNHVTSRREEMWAPQSQRPQFPYQSELASCDLPGGPVLKNLPCNEGMQLQSLIRELKPHMLQRNETHAT